MALVLQSIVLFAVIGFISCDTKCVTPVHYDQLGCAPVANPDGGCPKSFNCDHLKSRSDDVCYFDFGNKIGVGESFPYPANMTTHYGFTSPVCYDSCTCKAKEGSESARFECKDCVKRPTFEIVQESEAVCTVNGDFYKDGDQVFGKSNEDCKKNFCRKTGVEGIPLSCGFGIFSTYSLKTDCAPSYGFKSCCPPRWRCPARNGKEEITPAKTPVESDLRCKFGSLSLKLGESLPFDKDTCSACTCDLPPMLTCVIDEACVPALVT